MPTLRRDLAALTAREHDVLVIGGGIHGAAAVWEAASRGLRAALVERDDFGGGASWNSLKTIHGGLRHLQRLDLAGLRESARERRALLTIAPLLVRPLAFLVPVEGGLARGRAVLAAGLRLAGVLTPGRNAGLPPTHHIPRGRTLSRKEALARVPVLTGTPLSGAGLWWDAQVESSERLVLAFLHAAAGEGAALANRVEALEVLQGAGTVRGVRARDATTGAPVDVRARVVVNAGGPDAAPLAEGSRSAATTHLRAVNLVLRRSLVPDLALGARAGGRYLFCVPWRGRSIVGTAYAEASVPGAALAERFLAEAARAFPWAGLQPSDVALVHEGLVPGWGAESLLTRSCVVDHERWGSSGLLSIVAAKYTTARATAEAAVDLALRRLKTRGAPSRTAVRPLPDARPLEGTLEERTRRAVHEEMALSLSDAVLRRLDLGTAGEPERAEVDIVARVLEGELQWTPERTAAEKAALAAFFSSRRLP